MQGAFIHFQSERQVCSIVINLFQTGYIALCGVFRAFAGRFAAAEQNLLCDDFCGCALIAVLVLVVANFDAPNNGNEVALAEPLVYEFDGLSPCYDGYEVSLFPVTVAVYGGGKAAYALAAVGLLYFGGLGQTPIKDRFLQHSVSSKWLE